MQVITVDSGIELPWVENAQGDGSGFTLQRVRDEVYVDIYADISDVPEGKMVMSLMTTVDQLRAALNAA